MSLGELPLRGGIAKVPIGSRLRLRFVDYGVKLSRDSGTYMLGRFAFLFTCACALIVSADDPPGTPAGHSMHGDAFDEGPRQKAYLMEGTGNISFPIKTSREAQKFFNQGVGQLHGFWYFEAERSFRQVAMIDTNCAMAFWGMAMANTYNEKRAKEFIERAIQMTNGIPRREMLWIESLAKFHLKGNKSTTDAPATASGRSNTDDPERHRQYIKSLEQIVEEFPDDIEAKAFLTFKIWENNGRQKVSSHVATDALAREVLAANPMHPIHHARIHFWNGEVDRRALDSAAKCGQSAPGIAHMWHMPGHTYSSLHRYADAAWQQEASARVDHAYMMRNRVMPDQIHNYAHNNEWLIRNLSHLGRLQEALDLANNLVELPRHPRFNNLERAEKSTNSAAVPSDSTIVANDRRNNSAVYGRTRLLELLVDWELWDELIALSGTMYLEPTDIPEEQGRRARALGIAHFSKGNINAGEAAMEELDRVLKEQKAIRAREAEAAETKAKSEKQSDDKVLKAMTDELQKHAGRIKRTETLMREVRIHEALAHGRYTAASNELAELKDIPKSWQAQLEFRLGNTNKAEKIAHQAVESATNQVLPMARLVDLLARIGKTDAAAKEFQKLRKVAGRADLTAPALRRLAPLAKSLKLPDDWREPAEASSDVGQRPPLESLGPFRWRPSSAPEWTLYDSRNKPVSLADYRGKPVLAIFYLGHGCVHCLEQLNAFAPKYDEYVKAGIPIVAISTDTVSGLKKTFEKSKSGDGFPFVIVSDASMEVFKKYRAYDDFEATPLHGTFLIDGEGLVRWQDISYEPFTAPDFLLKEAKRLLKLPTKAEFVKSAPPTTRKGAELLRSKGAL